MIKLTLQIEERMNYSLNYFRMIGYLGEKIVLTYPSLNTKTQIMPFHEAQR